MAVEKGKFMGIEAKDCTNESEAMKRFADKHGYEPERAFRAGPVWLVGPIIESHEVEEAASES